MKINVLTYNIHKGFSFRNKKFSLPDLKDYFKLMDLDFVFLQEVQGEHKRNSKKHNMHKPHFEYLADQIWDHYAYGKNAVYKQGDHGNAILSKFPFIEWENISLTKIKRCSRSLLHGVVQDPETQVKVHLICLHFSITELFRKGNAQALCERIHSHVPDGAPLIIAGDFNDWREQMNLFLDQELQLKEAYELKHQKHAKTFPSIYPQLPLDRIYFRNLKLLDIECLKNEPWRGFSDHLPLKASFQIL